MLFVPDLQLVAWTEVRPGRGPGCASCRTRCRPPCPEHAAGRHFPRPRTQGVIFADNRIFYAPRPSVLPSVGLWRALPRRKARRCAPERIPGGAVVPFAAGKHARAPRPRAKSRRVPKRAGVSGHSPRGEMRFFRNFLNVSLETPKWAHVSFMLVPFPSMEKTSSCLSIRMDVFV